MSSLLHRADMCPEITQECTQHKIINILKTVRFFKCVCVFVWFCCLFNSITQFSA